MLDVKINLNKYNTEKVLQAELDYQHMLILDYIYEAIQTKKLTIQKDEQGRTHYVISLPALTNAVKDIKCSSDNVLRKVKNLHNKEFLTLRMGKFNDPIFGYTRTAIKLNRKFLNLLDKNI